MNTDLLSGFIGALIATMITIIYLYISEQVRKRSEVVLATIGHTDEFYHLIQEVLVYKDFLFKQAEQSITSEEYKFMQRRMIVLIKSFSIIAKVGLVYGEYSMELSNFVRLMNELGKVAILSTKADNNTWENDYKKIMVEFEKTVDPLKKMVQIDLLRSTNPVQIIKSNIYNLTQIFKKEAKNDPGDSKTLRV